MVRWRNWGSSLRRHPGVHAPAGGDRNRGSCEEPAARSSSSVVFKDDWQLALPIGICAVALGPGAACRSSGSACISKGSRVVIGPAYGSKMGQQWGRRKERSTSLAPIAGARRQPREPRPAGSGAWGWGGAAAGAGVTENAILLRSLATRCPDVRNGWETDVLQGRSESFENCDSSPRVGFIAEGKVTVRQQGPVFRCCPLPSSK